MRVTGAIVILVMLPGDDRRHLQQGAFGSAQQFVAKLTVFFHDFKFRRCERSRFIQNRIIHRQFPQIMHRGRQSDRIDFRSRQADFFRQDRRYFTDASDMVPGFHGTVFGDFAKSI